MNPLRGIFSALLCASLVSCVNPPRNAISPTQIPQGTRIVKVVIHDDVSVARGDRVDLLSVGKPGDTETVLENVEVAGIDKKQNMAVVSFVVAPSDAERIAALGEERRFVLRVRQG